MGKKKKNKNFIITLWLVAASMSFLGIVSYAAYTSSHTSKSVVATRGTSGIPFSSNYLRNGTEDSAERIPVSINKDSLDPNTNIAAFKVTVCNYPQENPAKFYTEKISYRLKGFLVDETGKKYTAETFPSTENRGDFYVVYKGNSYYFDDNFSLSIHESSQSYLDLKGYEQSTDEYFLYYPKSQLDEQNVYIKLVAEPKNKKDGIASLSGYLGIKPKTVEKVTGWSGGFIDSMDVEPEKYDGFNYRISGNGTADVTLSWDDSHINISKWFIEEFNEGKSEQDKIKFTAGKTNEITFHVDSSKVNSYTIQFYRTSPADEKESWFVDENDSRNCVIRDADGKVINEFVTFTPRQAAADIVEPTTSHETAEPTETIEST